MSPVHASLEHMHLHAVYMVPICNTSRLKDLYLKAFWRLLVVWHEHPSIVDDAVQLGVLIQKLVSKVLNRSANTCTTAISSSRCVLYLGKCARMCNSLEW